MRFRNFLPLIIYCALLVPLGLLFLFLWQGHGGPLVVLQSMLVPFLLLTYRASLRSVAKNFSPAIALNRAIYLPLKINIVLYFIIGIPLLLVFADSLSVLYVAYAVQALGFGFTCYSGMLYVSRSRA